MTTLAIANGSETVTSIETSQTDISKRTFRFRKRLLRPWKDGVSSEAPEQWPDPGRTVHHALVPYHIVAVMNRVPMMCQSTTYHHVHWVWIRKDYLDTTDISHWTHLMSLEHCHQRPDDHDHAHSQDHLPYSMNVISIITEYLFGDIWGADPHHAHHQCNSSGILITCLLYTSPSPRD